MVVTETWLNKNDSNNSTVINELTPTGYSFKHLARGEKRRRDWYPLQETTDA